MELPGGEAKPGPKLASAGINMAKFCTDFNAKTADRRGEIVPVIITAYEDKSCDFVIKTTPVAPLLLKAAGIQKGSATGVKATVGHISRAKLREIAEYKLAVAFYWWCLVVFLPFPPYSGRHLRRQSAGGG